MIINLSVPEILANGLKIKGRACKFLKMKWLVNRAEVIFHPRRTLKGGLTKGFYFITILIGLTVFKQQ